MSSTKNRGIKTTIGPFPASPNADGLYTTWMKIDGYPAVQYMRPDQTWAQIVEHTELETGLKSYDCSWSVEPGKIRTIWDRDEAVAFSLWLLR